VPERRLAVVPARNEEEVVARVVEELREFDPDLDVVVIDDGSEDLTASRAAAAGAAVVRLPFNLGIGGAVQTGFKYALAHGYTTVIRLDGDGQHDPQQIPNLLAPLERGEADVVVGSRFAEGGGDYKAPLARRAGIRWFARLVSMLTGQKLTDTTSGFQAVNARAIRLFAADYPHDYPEVEAVVMVVRHRLRILEVPAQMRGRETGRSSITLLRSLYYAIKVTLALLVGIFRRRVVPVVTAQDEHPRERMLVARKPLKGRFAPDDHPTEEG
jgi:glycosyltransferase involved in cell wall biosynthesis